MGKTLFPIISIIINFTRFPINEQYLQDLFFSPV